MLCPPFVGSLARIVAFAAVVFDFRGYDTLGESFVLLIAITGATVILRRKRDRWEGGKK